MTLRVVGIATLSIALLACFPVHAGMVATTSSGLPLLTSINPLTPVVPTPSVCSNGGPSGRQLPVRQQSPSLTPGRVDGLPGSSALPGYILKASRSATITVSGQNAGTLYDRVYCVGTGTTCNTSNTYILATRVRLTGAAAVDVTHWSRQIKSNVAVADVGYFMGTIVGGTDPNTAAARSFLEASGRANQGYGPTVRNNAWMMFQQNANANNPRACEPYNYSSAWTPWFYVRQSTATGFNVTAQPLKLRLFSFTWVYDTVINTWIPLDVLTSAYAFN